MLRMQVSAADYSYLENPSVPPMPEGEVFTVMDASCSLCAKGATWIAKYDTAEEFRIIPLQSELGQGLMVHYGLDPDDPVSWLFIEKGRAYSSLDAFIRAGRRLGGIWRVFGVLKVLPRGLQDRLYGVVARNRYRIFGKTDLCTLPNEEVQRRLVL